MKKLVIGTVRMDLFDGEGGGAAAPAAVNGQGEAAKAAPGGAGKVETVLYGKQGGQATVEAPAGEETGEPGAQESQEDRRRRYRELMSGEFKDIYTEDTQRMIDRRFRETRQLQEQLGKSRGILEMLMDRYKITDGDMGKLARAVENDSAYWSQAAEEAGMTVEQYKQVQRLQRQNAELLKADRERRTQKFVEETTQRWVREGEALKELYPHFDLQREVQDQNFVSMLRSGVPVKTAYEVIHMEEIKAGVAAMTAKAAEKQVVNSIRAKGSRPAENGTAAQSAFTIKDDVSKLTKEDRAEIARRAARGDSISF